MSEALNRKILELTGTQRLHDLGHKGGRLKAWAAENPGDGDGHERTTMASAKILAPELNITAVQNETGIFTRAKAQGIHIVNVSMEDVSFVGLDEYLAWGGIVFVAVGNNYASALNRDRRFISVGMITLAGVIPAWSAKTDAIDLVSYVPYIKNSEGDYFQPNGTSFASPSAMGSMACALDQWISLGVKYDQTIVEDYLRRHAVDTQQAGFDNASGYGIVKVGLTKKIDLEVGGKAYINSQEVPIDVPAQVVSGRTLVPTRFIAEAMGGVVSYLPPSPGRLAVVTILQALTAKKIDLEVGGKAYINGKEVPIDVPAQIVSGRTLVPARFIAEALGGIVSYTPPSQGRLAKVTILQEF